MAAQGDKATCHPLLCKLHLTRTRGPTEWTWYCLRSLLVSELF